MRYLAARGQGYPTAGGPVPIVPAACIFDLVESGGRAPGRRRRRSGRGARGARRGARDRAGRRGRRRDGRQVARPRRCGPRRDRRRLDDGRRRAHRRAGGGERDRRRDRRRRTRARGLDRSRTTVPAFPTPDPFEEELHRANTTLAVVVTDARVRQGRLLPARAERARRLRARAAALAHALRRRSRGGGGDRRRRRATSTACVSRRPRSWPTRSVADLLDNIARVPEPGRSVSIDSITEPPHPADGAGATLAEVAAASQHVHAVQARGRPYPGRLRRREARRRPHVRG